MVVLTSMSLYCYATTPLKDDWRSETQFVLERVSVGELVAVEPDHEIETLLYYISRRGATPPEMIGLTSMPVGNGQLAGIRYLNGTRSDRDARDCKDSVLSSAGIWLILVASRATTEFNRDYFTRNGFRLVEHRHSHRIEILHFTR